MLSPAPVLLIPPLLLCTRLISWRMSMAVTKWNGLRVSEKNSYPFIVPRWSLVELLSLFVFDDFDDWSFSLSLLDCFSLLKPICLFFFSSSFSLYGDKPALFPFWWLISLHFNWHMCLSGGWQAYSWIVSTPPNPLDPQSARPFNSK